MHDKFFLGDTLHQNPASAGVSAVLDSTHIKNLMLAGRLFTITSLHLY